jgi:hypothetical protein
MTLITIIFAIVVFGILIAFPLVKRGHGKVPFSPRTAAKQPREEVNLPPANAPESDRNEDKKKGYFFEQFVVSKFSEQYFTLMHWRSDKFFNGIYAQSNMNLNFMVKSLALRSSVNGGIALMPVGISIFASNIS